jgi:hypothetical protein
MNISYANNKEVRQSVVEDFNNLPGSYNEIVKMGIFHYLYHITYIKFGVDLKAVNISAVTETSRTLTSNRMKSSRS